MQSIINNQIIKLEDGRKLAFNEYGDKSGKPVFFFHGSAGSRLERPQDETMLHKLGIRFITTDRPGHGLSDHYPNRKLTDWPDDISQLAKYLNINKFYVMGWSAGGPYALACASKLTNQIIACAIISGLAPANRPHPYKNLPLLHKAILFVMRNIPRLVYKMRKGMHNALSQKSNEIAEIIMKSLVEADKKIFQNKKIQEAFINDIKEGYRKGFEGPALDDIIINRNWNFKLEEIKKRIDIWQGEKDKNVPMDQGLYMNNTIANSRINLMPNEAHLFLLTHWKQVLIKLLN